MRIGRGSAWIVVLVFAPALAWADAWTWDSGYKGDAPDAVDIATDTTLFGTNLSATDTDVQKALDTLDELVGGGSGDITAVGDQTTGAAFNALNTGTTLTFSNATSGTIALTPVTGALGTVTLRLPAATDTLVGKATTDTLTNKTLAAADNVIAADTAVALAANGGDCSAGAYPLGVDASGASESCTTAVSAAADVVTGSAQATLSAEQSLGALTTGLLLNTSAAGTGTLSQYAGTACTNQFPRSLSVSGAATCAEVALTTDTSGNYISSATANEGLLVTGTEGASVGLQDCAANQVLKRNAGDTAWACAADADSGGATAWDAIGDPTTAADVAFGGLSETISANTDDVTAIAQDVLTLTFTNDAATDILTQQILVVQNAAGANGVETGLLIQNADTDDVMTDGLKFDTAAGAITTALNAEDAQIVTALSVAANDIVGTTGLINYTNFDVDAAGKVVALGGADIGTTNTVNVSSAGAITFAGTAQPYGRILLSPANALPGGTSAPGFNAIDGTNVDYYVLEFDTTTSEVAYWSFPVPANLTGSTVEVVIDWTNDAGLTTETVQWDVSACGVADDEVLDCTLGAEVSITDTWLAQGDRHRTPAGTLTHGWAAGDTAFVRIDRDTAADDLTGDAQLLAVEIRYDVSGLNYQ